MKTNEEDEMNSSKADGSLKGMLRMINSMCDTEFVELTVCKPSDIINKRPHDSKDDMRLYYKDGSYFQIKFGGRQGEDNLMTEIRNHNKIKIWKDLIPNKNK